jgi:ABC-2 type transport system permease protein
MTTARQAWIILTGRYLRELYRQPAVIFITLTQPVIWLLLFGELFKNVTQLPGFASGNYATYLTPGVVIMTAIFSSSWTGMAYIEDMQTGVMDRFLTAPVGRGALTVAMLAYQAVIVVVQSAIIIAMAGLSIGFALLVRQREALIGVSTTLVLPLTFLSGAFLSLRLVPGWIADIARFNPVNWAASAGRLAIGGHAEWGTVGSYAGFLALALAVTAVAATRAFRTYQRSA